METERTIFIPSTPSPVALRVPEGVRLRVASPPEVEGAPRPGEMIRQALDAPIGSPRVEELVKKGDKVCIIADDLTRPTPVALILSQLLPRLHRAGVEREDVTIVMALGSHRPMTPGEMAQRVGPEVFARYRVLNSEFRDPSLLVQVGTSRLGTPIRVFRPAMEADVRIAIGNIVPHGTMGWAGGAKILYPGITAEDIVSEFHIMQGFQKDIVFGRDESEIRLAVEEWTRQIGLHFIINTVLNGRFELYQVVAGHYVQAHRKGVEYAKRALGVALDGRPNIVLSSSYPMDIDFWQCIKGVWSAGNVIDQGGTMLVLGPCVEGLGAHRDFPGHIGLEDGEEVLRRAVRAGEGEDLISMAIGVSVGKLRRRCQIHWFSDGITREELEPSGFLWHGGGRLQEVFDQVLTRYDRPDVLVIPMGSETLTYVED